MEELHNRCITNRQSFIFFWSFNVCLIFLYEFLLHFLQLLLPESFLQIFTLLELFFNVSDLICSCCVELWEYLKQRLKEQRSTTYFWTFDLVELSFGLDESITDDIHGLIRCGLERDYLPKSEYLLHFIILYSIWITSTSSTMIWLIASRPMSMTLIKLILLLLFLC